MRRFRFFAGGFTMVELLITLALMTIVFGVLFSMLSGGLRVWQRLQCGVRQEHAVYFAFDQIRKGLHEVHPFEPIPFKGGTDRMEFPALLDAQELSDTETLREPGKVSFYFERAESRLCRSERLFRGMRKDTRRQVCKPLADNIDKVSFIYSGYNSKSESFTRSGSWSDKQPPVSVQVQLEYHDPCSEKKFKKEFLVAIPVGPIR